METGMRFPGFVFSLLLLAGAPASWAAAGAEAAPVDPQHRAAILEWKSRVLDPYGTVTIIDHEGRPMPESAFIDLLIERRAGAFRMTRIETEGAAPVMRIELIPAEEEAADRRKPQARQQG
jgi:hypothetical protein